MHHWAPLSDNLPQILNLSYARPGHDQLQPDRAPGGSPGAKAQATAARMDVVREGRGVEPTGPDADSDEETRHKQTGPQVDDEPRLEIHPSMTRA